MNTQAVESLSHKQLAQLLDVDAVAAWGDRDGTAALLHQLAAPLLPDLAEFCSVTTIAKWCDEMHRQTFLEQLTLKGSQVDILVAIKNFARHMREDLASPLNGVPATVLYFAAIARARVVGNAHIAQLSDAKIREGCQWALQQEGTQEMTELFRAAIQKLR